METVVIGAGYVGLVAAVCLADAGHHVICVEADRARLAMLSAGTCPIRETSLDDLLRTALRTGRLSFSQRVPSPLRADVAVVAVGTPSNETGATDLSQVSTAAAQIADAVDQPLVVAMKSTVPPGTGLRLTRRYFHNCPVSYVSNPEFMREGQAVSDWRNPSRIVIGAADPAAADTVRRLYSTLDAPIVVTDTTSAEAIKYAANAFLVTKISFINEIASLCDVVGAHIDDVARGIGLDPRIGPDFLRAGLGYGGSCFPKDARGLDFAALNNGYDFRLLKSTIEVNAKQCIQAVRRLKTMVGDLEGAEVAILGLAFKPDTDDIRESPALVIARLLHDEGCRIRACDPAAAEKAIPHLPAGTLVCEDVYVATAGASAVLLVTEWRDFVGADWQSIRGSMRPPYAVLDGRNALAQDQLVALGFTYCGIGRSIVRPGVAIS